MVTEEATRNNLRDKYLSGSEKKAIGGSGAIYSAVNLSRLLQHASMNMYLQIVNGCLFIR